MQRLVWKSYGSQCRTSLPTQTPNEVFPSGVCYTIIEFFVHHVSNTTSRFSTRNSFRTNECTYHLLCELLLGAFARPLATSRPFVRTELDFRWEDFHENFVMGREGKFLTKMCQLNSSLVKIGPKTNMQLT